MKIRALHNRPVPVPFRRPPVSASGAVPKAALVLFDLETDEGVTGRSYVFGFAPWTLGPIVGAAPGLFEMIEGDRLAPTEIEAKLRRQLTLLDTPGLVGLALAGIDMAAWDALARAQGVPLVALLGRGGERIVSQLPSVEIQASGACGGRADGGRVPALAERGRLPYGPGRPCRRAAGSHRGPAAPMSPGGAGAVGRLIAALRFAGAVRGFLRERLTVTEACEIVTMRLARRGRRDLPGPL